jgi:anti-sigma factor RsiW
MTCEVFRGKAHDYYMDHLPERERTELDRHAGVCPQCGAFKQLCEELTCRDFVEFLNDYLEEELPAERRAVFERHLAICPDCTRYLDSYRKTMALGVRALGGGPPFPEEPIPEDLVRAILEARKRQA